MLEYDDLIDAPRRAAHVWLERAEAFALAELYLRALLEGLTKPGRAPQDSASDDRVTRRLTALMSQDLMAAEEVDQIAERLLAERRGGRAGGHLAGLLPTAPHQLEQGGLRFVRRRLRREGVPGADLRCLYAVYAEAWSQGTIELGTLPHDERAYQTIKKLMSEVPPDGPLRDDEVPF